MADMINVMERVCSEEIKGFQKHKPKSLSPRNI
jgi:hypothetical protein